MKFKFMNLAKKISKKSSHKFQLGCVIVKQNHILSLGFNSNKTHPRSNHPFRSTHAEVDAIASTDLQDLHGSVAYLYRETKDGKRALSKPCKHCEKLLKKVGVKKVYYTTDEFPFWKEEYYGV